MKPHYKFNWIVRIFLLLAVFSAASFAKTEVLPGARNFPRRVAGIVYAHRPGGDLMLDLYFPKDRKIKKPYPVILWIHGGGFTSGAREGIFASPILISKRGYVLASIDYRFALESTFPSQVYDCKEAVRWLRAHGKQYELATEKIGVWGESAGAYLATFLGVTGGVSEFEGSGANLEFSSSVQAVAHYYGPTNFSLDNMKLPKSPEVLFLGGLGPQLAERMKEANVLNYITRDDPPFFILHGTADNFVPCKQSEVLYEELVKNDIYAEINLIKAGHAPFYNDILYSEDNVQKTLDFFDKFIRNGR